MFLPIHAACKTRDEWSARTRRSPRVVAIVTPGGQGVPWFMSSCFSIIQHYFVTGWGGLRPPAALRPRARSPIREPVGEEDEEG